VSFFIIENSELRVRIDSKGAELQELFSKKDGYEYMWQPGQEIWDHHSLILFPNPGRIALSRVIISGKVYPARMHGFAHEMEFSPLESTRENLTLELSASEYTKKYFPYEFTLRVIFSLQGKTLVQKFEVINRDSRTMYFSLGAHPGFYCPIDIGETGDDYVLRFSPAQRLNRLILEKGTRLLTGKKELFLNGETDIQLGDHFFDAGPMLFDGLAADSIILLSLKSGRFIELGVKDFNYLCLWGAANRMSVICVEPWCGISDLAGTDHVWETKLGIEKAEPGVTFTRFLIFKPG
jgi:galactose mutarotase-like enzyme